MPARQQPGEPPTQLAAIMVSYITPAIPPEALYFIKRVLPFWQPVLGTV